MDGQVDEAVTLPCKRQFSPHEANGMREKTVTTQMPQT